MSALSLSPSRSLGRQDNHYRPEGSDTCLLCDCYPVGSFSRACERQSGQCQCKPGVIGRQCDRCDNPFAEVSPNGCEGRQGFCFFFPSSFCIFGFGLPDFSSPLPSATTPSHLRQLPSGHRGGNLVAADQVRPPRSRFLSQGNAGYVCVPRLC